MSDITCRYLCAFFCTLHQRSETIGEVVCSNRTWVQATMPTAGSGRLSRGNLQGHTPWIFFLLKQYCLEPFFLHLTNIWRGSQLRYGPLANPATHEPVDIRIRKQGPQAVLLGLETMHTLQTFYHFPHFFLMFSCGLCVQVVSSGFGGVLQNMATWGPPRVVLAIPDSPRSDFPEIRQFWIRFALYVEHHECEKLHSLTNCISWWQPAATDADLFHLMWLSVAAHLALRAAPQHTTNINFSSHEWVHSL